MPRILCEAAITRMSDAEKLPTDGVVLIEIVVDGHVVTRTAPTVGVTV